MSTFQCVVVCGHLGADPETRHTQAGDAVTNLSIATSEQWKDKQTGEKREQTEWHRVTLWGRTAEVAQEYLKKGSKALIRGRLQTRKWTDKDGIDRWTTEIRADELKLMGDGGSGDKSAKDEQRGDWQNGQAEYARASGGSQAARRESVVAGAGPEDDIPF